ncbi:hypothetical protein CDAR_236481 [Caerostris darwini]|uniref:Uncharacterized protein n=1 Tax=Caerostris darwini TaxID=1538125 RepID=A0AAV4TA41_9ARAC|nr:hypothetical protein CDAR_236481 [Caerostris darwini]
MLKGVETEAWVWRGSASNESTRRTFKCVAPETQRRDRAVHFGRILQKGWRVCSKGTVESLGDDSFHASFSGNQPLKISSISRTFGGSEMWNIFALK